MTLRRTLLRNFALLGLLLLLAPFARADNTVWLLINPVSGDSIFSTDVLEKKRLVDGNWKVNAEMQIWSEGAADRSELHRMVRSVNGRSERLVTGRADEVAAATKAGFIDEGVIGYVALKKLNNNLVPVSRWKNGERFLWLLNKADQPWAEKAGWKLVGEDFWVMPSGK